MAGAVPFGFVLLVVCPAGLLTLPEVALLVGGLPLHTPLNLSASTILQVPLFCDLTGAAVLTFDNTIGAIDIFGVQAILTDSLGLAVGTSEVDLL